MLEDYDNPFYSMPIAFPNFKKLPAELRLKIWQDALPGPRTIHLVNNITSVPSPTKTHNSDDEEPLSAIPEFSNDYQFKIRQPRSSPKPRRRRKSTGLVSHCMATVKCPVEITSLLHTCRESRFEVSRRFEALYTPKDIDDPHFRIHYFDPLNDGIFVDEIWPWVRGGRCKLTGLLKCRRLAISCNAWYFKWAVNSPQLLGKSGLLRFKDLEELDIIYRVLTDHERGKIIQYKFGQYMGPGDMTKFLRRPSEPHDIAFPSIHVEVHKKPIMERLAIMKEANPSWSNPEVKIVAWATTPDVTFASSRGNITS